MMSIPLDSYPIDVWRISPHNNAEIHNLNKAKSKLLEEDLPLSTRAISYIRVCSVVMQILVKDIGDKMPLSYSTILAALQSTDAKWWRDCYVDQCGYLCSKNQQVQALLQPINSFVQGVLTV